MRRISETVGWERFEAGATDSHGNPAEGWMPSVPLGIYAFNPGGTEETLFPGHERVISTPTIYVPSDKILSPQDRVNVRGLLYEVQGVTRDFRNPFNSSMNGCSVDLKRVEG